MEPIIIRPDTKIAELIKLELKFPHHREFGYNNIIKMDNNTWKIVFAKFTNNRYEFRGKPIFNIYSYSRVFADIFHHDDNSVLIRRGLNTNPFVVYEVDDLAEEFLGDLLKFTADLEVESRNLKPIRISSFSRQIPKAAQNND